MASLQELLDKFIADGVLTYDEHEDLMNRIHADGKIDADEKAVISKIFSLIQSGQLVVVNDEREASVQRRKEEIKQKMLQSKKTSE